MSIMRSDELLLAEIYQNYKGQAVQRQCACAVGSSFFCGTGRQYVELFA